MKVINNIKTLLQDCKNKMLSIQKCLYVCKCYQLKVWFNILFNYNLTRTDKDYSL